jgi:hypothetical protein
MYIPPVEIDRALQLAFCHSSLKCVSGPCTGCIYDKSNFNEFVQMMQEKNAPEFKLKNLKELTK